MTSPPGGSSENGRGEPCFRRNPAILERRIDETVFLVNPEDDTIFYLNPLSSGLWRLLAEPIRMAEATRVVQEAFPDTPPAKIAADVDGLFAELGKKGLVLQRPPGDGAEPEGSLPPPAPPRTV